MVSHELAPIVAMQKWHWLSCPCLLGHLSQMATLDFNKAGLSDPLTERHSTGQCSNPVSVGWGYRIVPKEGQ